MSVTEQSYVSDEVVLGLSPEAQSVLAPFIERRHAEIYDEVLDAEIRSQITKTLRSYYTPVSYGPEKYTLDHPQKDLPQPQHIGSQFARQLQEAFLAQDVYIGLSRFKDMEPTTIDQLLVCSTTDTQFERIWNLLQNFFTNNCGVIKSVVEDRFAVDSTNGHENRAAFKNNDIYQFRGRETARSLGAIAQSGIVISVNPDGTRVLEHAAEQAEYEHVPLTELVKNWPILTISGFTGSKLSLAIHDSVDHAWTFSLAESAGLLAKYEAMFKSIGLPHSTDIFKREGEILSSISFGGRYWERQPGFVPLFSTSFLENHLKNLTVNQHLLERHQAALNILTSLDQNSDEYESLGFVFSNYLVTLHEQRRRYGQIKQKSTEVDVITGELNPLDPDFVCFFIELHHEIYKSGENRKVAIDSVHILLESYLQSVAKRRIATDSRLIIYPEHNSQPCDMETCIPQADIDWLIDHSTFSTIKERIKA